MPDNVTHKFPPVSFPASWVAIAHTTLASLAFLTALAVGTGLHYKKIVKNGVAGYPQEWFPSVSATYAPSFDSRRLPDHNRFRSALATGIQREASSKSSSP
jgi:hypothetical protein